MKIKIGDKVKILANDRTIIVTIDGKQKYPHGIMYFGKTAYSAKRRDGVGHGFYASHVMEKIK